MELEELIERLKNERLDGLLIGIFKESAKAANVLYEPRLRRAGFPKNRAKRILHSAKGLNSDDERGWLASCARHTMLQLATNEEAYSQILNKYAALASPGPAPPKSAPPLIGSEALGLSLESQRPFKAWVVGEYLVFRLIQSQRVLCVSHMTVSDTCEDPVLTKFVTVRPASNFDRASVVGVMYAHDHHVFAVGRVDGTAELRSTILKDVTRARPAAPDALDMIGVRAAVGVLLRNPRAYRIWCYRLERPRSPAVLASLLGDHQLLGEKLELDESSVLRSEVGNLRHIIQFLDVPDTDLDIH